MGVVTTDTKKGIKFTTKGVKVTLISAKNNYILTPYGVNLNLSCVLCNNTRDVNFKPQCVYLIIRIRNYLSVSAVAPL